MSINWPVFADQLINGLTVGSFYALIALGYTMVYGVLLMINFAHSEIFMVGAYSGLFTMNRLAEMGLYETSPALAILLTFLGGAIGAALTGVTLERLAYRPLRKATRLAPLISAIGASFFLQELVRLLPTIGKAVMGIRLGGQSLFPVNWQQSIIKLMDDFGGSKVKIYPGIMTTAGFDIGDIHVRYSQVVILVSSLLIMAALYLLVRYTRLGKAMRAVAEDKEAAALMGIDINQIISRTFLIGSMLAGVAGVMMGMYYLQIRTTMGFVPGIKAFTAAVLGGIGNIPGAMLGGYVLGLAEAIGLQFLPAVYKDVVAFGILVLILIFKPTGILGEVVAQKKL
ncbi:MAG: branched-chain amino acid ABC transporter permease [Anaerolineae bacterium]|nr:branched-chain amino acid ABC transporter permease [Anaerolineae bacterium]